MKIPYRSYSLLCVLLVVVVAKPYIDGITTILKPRHEGEKRNG